jgi:hypothetical protein
MLESKIGSQSDVRLVSIEGSPRWRKRGARAIV